MDIYNHKKITNKSINELMHVTAKKRQLIENSVNKGDIFFTPTSETADDIGHCTVIEENLENTVYSYHLMRYRPFKGMYYLTYPNFAFETYYVRKQMELMAQGVQRFVISKGQFESIDFLIPSLDEQEKIATLLTNLDSLITLHQRNYNKINN